MGIMYLMLLRLQKEWFKLKSKDKVRNLEKWHFYGIRLMVMGMKELSLKIALHLISPSASAPDR